MRGIQKTGRQAERQHLKNGVPRTPPLRFALVKLERFTFSTNQKEERRPFLFIRPHVLPEFDRRFIFISSPKRAYKH